jgi:hypothetical protein
MVYIADWMPSPEPTRRHRILEFDPKTERTTEIIGLNVATIPAPLLRFPQGLVGLPNNSLCFADRENNRILEFDINRKTLTTLVESSSTNGIAYPESLAFDGRSTLYFTEGKYAWVRAIDLQTRTVRQVAGSRTPGYSGDGEPALDARMANPMWMATDGNRTLFISDWFNNRVRAVNLSTGIINAVLGNRPAHTLNRKRP